jgi:hypothetical protein
MSATVAPDRGLAQRRDALVFANAVRTHRKRLKADLYAARVDADAVLVSGDPLVATMKVWDLVLAVPGLGAVKANLMFRRNGISTSKTIGGISPRQRGLLLVELRQHRAASNTYRARKAQA